MKNEEEKNITPIAENNIIETINITMCQLDLLKNILEKVNFVDENEIRKIETFSTEVLNKIINSLFYKTSKTLIK